MQKKYFVTLTVPNCPGDELADVLEQLYTRIRAINKKIRKYDKVNFKGLRKVECTYNMRRKDFHPHFHMVLNSKKAGKLFIKYWLQENPTANRKAQDIRKADNTACLELFKYFTKICAKKGENDSFEIHAESLDTIFQAMRNKRVFQAMGIKKVKEDIAELVSQTIEGLDIRETTWLWHDKDWKDISTDQALTNYTPSEAIEQLSRSASGVNQVATLLEKMQRQKRNLYVDDLEKAFEHSFNDSP